jgi:tetratricopeptide (TPR) repeat protein
MLLGNLSSRLRDAAATQKYYDKALEIRQKLADDSPHSLKANQDLAVILGHRGDFKLQILQKPDLALPDYERSRQISQSLHDRDAKDAAVRELLAQTHHRLGTAHVLLGQETEAQTNFRTAVTLRRALADADVGNTAKELSLMQSLARAGEHAEAFKRGESLLPRVKNNQDLYQLVCGFAICAAVASQSTTESPPSVDQPLVQQYASAGIHALKQAVELGFNNLTALETDPDLTAIRNDPRFVETMQRLKK